MDTYQSGEFIFKCHNFLPFHAFHGVLKARMLNWFTVPFSSGPHFAELSIMTHLSWVALHGMAHSFIKLDKAAIHMVNLVNLVFILSAL